ncbi:uroporphyrinogen decarboxylase family protein [Paludicola sp. MB14-C6]|uniref:uroporphyrinogen decarboxylase family protein n=1 Tax=Paludihabitans sp. MB14-C6 TaxID=3070656 RepID=UPI0027DB685E|nr:uroporphyrinogen decarboxylase family protein [Paludicola sp. MB14-C6]WMJ22603.1 uroporphyrinogen decarboxylase family protein [Paludicola sp. MB14-C6]
MTGKERFAKALRREKIEGHVPHFELVFFLTMEVLGKVHPSHRFYEQWNQMSHTEKKLQMEDMADCYIKIAEKYHHDAIFVHPNPWDLENVKWLLETIREKTGDQYFLLMHGDTTCGIPDGESMMEFTTQMYEEPEKILEQQKSWQENAFKTANALSKTGLLDGFALCSDYSFNVNPFFSPDIFGELIAPNLKETIDTYRKLGFYSIKHTDGNINPILDQIVACGPDALHSIDPQGGMSLTEVRQKYGDKICTIGNVNCGLLQTGTDEEAAADVRRTLKEGMANGYGYIFSTSNCVYTGLDLKRYEMMNQIWREEGIYR